MSLAIERYKIAMIGAGPVGCILTANLVKAKQQVALIDTNKKLITHIAKNGIHITGVQNCSSRPYVLFTSISQLKDFRPTIIFIATKAWANKVVVNELKKLALPSCIYVVAQNGLDNEKDFEVLLDTFCLAKATQNTRRYGNEKNISISLNTALSGDTPIYAKNTANNRIDGTVSSSNFQSISMQRKLYREAQNSPSTVIRMVIQFAGISKAPGEIHMTFFDPPSLIGNSTLQAKLISNVLSDASLPTKVVSDIRRHEWKKTILNAAMNPLSALHKKTIGEVLQNRKLKKELLELIKEARAVARADGYVFEDTFIEKALTHMSLGASHKTSMFQDLEIGNKTETSVLSKKIIELGNRYGVEVLKTVRLNNALQHFT